MTKSVFKVETIDLLHQVIGFEKPLHPLVTIIDYSKVNVENAPETASFMCGFYSINFKDNCTLLYGRQSFDHQEGTLLCVAPDQLLTFDREKALNESRTTKGWGLYFHPELIRNTTLGDKIHDYSFFSYEDNEALHVSEQENNSLQTILKQIEREYQSNIDQFSNELIVSNIELLLNYCKRFYGRQFITRTNQNKDHIARFEKFISDYCQSGRLEKEGIPSVKYCAEAMHLSPNYFSDLLKNETGKNAQEHIHFYLLERGKQLLASSDLSISEIAFALGFEYSQSFSSLFKKKFGISPSMYRVN